MPLATQISLLFSLYFKGVTDVSLVEKLGGSTDWPFLNYEKLERYTPKRQVHEQHKTLSRAQDPRANGAWLNELTE